MNEAEENDLYDMEQELRHGIDKVKNLASACKLNSEDEVPFLTDDAGVLLSPPRN